MCLIESVLGSHDSAIRAVEYSSEVNGILTGSWDATVKMWDPRASRCVGNYTQPDKVYYIFIYLLFKNTIVGKKTVSEYVHYLQGLLLSFWSCYRTKRIIFMTSNWLARLLTQD